MDLIRFLRDNGFTESEADAYYIVKFFDCDEDGHLNYQEFLSVVLPCDRPKLRN